MNTKKIIDLTQPIYDGMPVYPGDPEVSIKPVFTVEKDVISFEKLANTDQLPRDTTFTFYGIPLLIKEGDGAPCRVFVEV